MMRVVAVGLSSCDAYVYVCCVLCVFDMCCSVCVLCLLVRVAVGVVCV